MEPGDVVAAGGDPGGVGVARGGAALAAILVASFLLKLALLVPAHRTVPVGDAFDYLVAARMIRLGDYQSIRPPLWPATLFAASWAASQWSDDALTPAPHLRPGQRRPPRPPVSDLDLARFVNVVFSTLTAWLLFRLGCELFDRRAGLFAAGIFAFSPTFVGYSHLLWAETQFALLNVAWMWLLLLGLRRERLRILVAGGICFALAALTRQLLFGFGAVIALWIPFVRGRPWRRSLRPAAAFALAAGLTVAPWSVRNAIVHREFIPIAPMSGWALLHGISKDVRAEMERAGIPAAVSRPNPVAPIETDRMARARALQVIRADPSAYAVHALTVNLPDLFRFGSRVLEHARYGEGGGRTRQHGYGGVPPRLGLALIALFVAAYVATVSAGLAGMALAPRWRVTLLHVAILGQAVAMHTLIGANLRHRIYLLPFLIVYAGFAVSRRRCELRALATRSRLLAGGAALAAFAALLVASDPVELREQWSYFRAQAKVQDLLR